jgi:hypothetical protein
MISRYRCAFGARFVWQALHTLPGAVDPSIDMKTAVREQLNALDAAEQESYAAMVQWD